MDPSASSCLSSSVLLGLLVPFLFRLGALLHRPLQLHQQGELCSGAQERGGKPGSEDLLTDDLKKKDQREGRTKVRTEETVAQCAAFLSN